MPNKHQSTFRNALVSMVACAFVLGSTAYATSTPELVLQKKIASLLILNHGHLLLAQKNVKPFSKVAKTVLALQARLDSGQTNSGLLSYETGVNRVSKQIWIFTTGPQVQSYTMCGLVKFVHVIGAEGVIQRATLKTFTSSTPSICQPKVGDHWTYRTEHTIENVPSKPEHPTTIDRNLFECAALETKPSDLGALKNISENVVTVQCKVKNERNDSTTIKRLLFLEKQRVYVPVSGVLATVRKMTFELCSAGKIAEAGKCV